MKPEDKKSIYRAVSIAVRAGVKKYGPLILLDFSEKKRNSETEKKGSLIAVTN